MNSREEALLREYVRLSLRDNKGHILNEGVKDVLKKALTAGLSKLSDLVTKLKQFMPASDQVVGILEKNGASDAVSKIDTAGREFETSVDAAAESIPTGKNESTRRSLYRRNRKPTVNEARARRQALNEIALGGFEIIGLILAAIGGVPLVLKGAYKLANLMGLKGTGEKLKSAYKTAHHFEEKFIDIVIPDKALYAVYIALEENQNPDSVANLKLYQDDPSTKLDGKRSLTLEEFRESDVRKKYEKRAYALVLLPWLISGLTSLGHMFHGWIGALEGAATVEKALFVGAEASEIAPIASDIIAAVSGLSSAS